MTEPEPEPVDEALTLIASLIESGALDRRVVARVLWYGGLIPAIEGMIGKAAPADAATMARLLACARVAKLSAPEMESNVEFHARKMIVDAHAYSLAHAGFYVDAASGSLVQACPGDMETQVKCLGDSILSHARKLGVAAHADHMGV